MLFVTISPKVEDLDGVRRYTHTLLASDEVTFLVWETGKQGTHPHVHYIINTNQRSDKYLAKVRRELGTKILMIKELSVLKRMIKTRTITDLNGLLFYLHKETQKDIQKNTLNIDLSKLKSGRSYLKLKEWNYVPNIIDFPHYFIHYCTENDLTPEGHTRAPHFQNVLKLMAKDNIYVMHLFRHEEQIMRMLDYMLS